MKKYIKCFTLTAVCLLFLFGCGKKEENIQSQKPMDNIPETVYETQEEQQNIVIENTVSEETEPLILGVGSALLVEDYKEDRTWVYSNAYNDASWLMLDKAGNVLVGLPSTAAMCAHFDNGYAHVRSGDVFFTIDRLGNVVNRIESNPLGEQVVIYGGGYTVTKQNVSNFDAVGYQYTVYNVDGSVNGTFITETDGTSLLGEKVLYIGKGVFFINDGIYCAKVGKRIDNLYGDYTKKYNFVGDRVFVTTAYDDERGNSCIITLTEDGVVEKVGSDLFSNNIIVSDIINNVCVVFDLGNDRIYSFNVATNDIYELDASYYDNIPSWLWNNAPPAPHNERIVIQLEGADGNAYSAIFDVFFNLIEGPILGSFSEPSEGLITAAVYRDSLKDEVYDKDGNFVYSISDLNYSRKGSNYSCGAIAVCNWMNEYVYLDTNGNLLFNSLNFDRMKLIAVE